MRLVAVTHSELTRIPFCGDDRIRRVNTEATEGRGEGVVRYNRCWQERRMMYFFFESFV